MMEKRIRSLERQNELLIIQMTRNIKLIQEHELKIDWLESQLKDDGK